jgi:hypothetical protein
MRGAERAHDPGHPQTRRMFDPQQACDTFSHTIRMLAGSQKLQPETEPATARKVVKVLQLWVPPNYTDSGWRIKCPGVADSCPPPPSFLPPPLPQTTHTTTLRSRRRYRKLSPSMEARGEWGAGDDARMLRALWRGREAWLQEWQVAWDTLVPGRTGEQVRARPLPPARPRLPPLTRTCCVCGGFLLAGDPAPG